MHHISGCTGTVAVRSIQHLLWNVCTIKCNSSSKIIEYRTNWRHLLAKCLYWTQFKSFTYAHCLLARTFLCTSCCTKSLPLNIWRISDLSPKDKHCLCLFLPRLWLQLTWARWQAGSGEWSIPRTLKHECIEPWCRSRPVKLLYFSLVRSLNFVTSRQLVGPHSPLPHFLTPHWVSNALLLLLLLSHLRAKEEVSYECPPLIMTIIAPSRPGAKVYLMQNKHDEYNYDLKNIYNCQWVLSFAK